MPKYANKRRRRGERKATSYRKKRRYTKRIVTARVPSLIVRPPGLLGNTKTVHMRYADNTSLTPGPGGNNGVQLIRANSCFDPDGSIGGHQPLGFDQLLGPSKFFNHYTVTHCKLKVTLMNLSDTPMFLSVYPRYNATLEYDHNTVMEQANSKTVVCPPTGSGRAQATITMYLDLSKFLGQKVINEDANAGTSTANPTEQVFFHVCLAASDGAATMPCRILWETDMTTILHEPVLTTGS